MPYKVSFQLYSSREFPPLEAQFPVLKALGYDAVEPWLAAYAADAKGFRRALDDAGLACHGFHMPLKGLIADPERFVDIALTLGARYLICPYVEPSERVASADFWKGVGDRLAEGAARVASRGLSVVWHNHDFEYVPLPDGTRPIDHILGGGDDVLFEIDCGWLVRAGADPEAELRRYADRIAFIQLKDTAPPGTTVEDGWTATGDGIIDWSALVPAMRRTAAEHIVAEHDNPADWRRFAERSINHMRALGL